MTLAWTVIILTVCGGCFLERRAANPASTLNSQYGSSWDVTLVATRGQVVNQPFEKLYPQKEAPE